MAQSRLFVVELIKDGKPQSVAISQTSQVVSESFQINAEDSMALSFQVKTSAATGTAGIVKIQHSIDNVTWADVDATNAKITMTAAASYPLILNGFSSTLSAKMPLYRWCRFVSTTTSGDTATISSILVQLHN